MMIFQGKTNLKVISTAFKVLARDKMTSRTFPEIIRLLIQEQEIEDG
jgi:hypothetical protein